MIYLMGFGVALLMVGGLACVSMGASGGNPYTYIYPEASISHEAKLYEPFTVTGKATAQRQDLADAQLWLTVTGAVYLGGEDRWHGPLKTGETKTIQATFAFVTPGEREVSARVIPDTGQNRPQAQIDSFPIHFQVNDVHGSRVPLPEHVTAPTDLPMVPGGHAVVVDTTLLLNRSATPRIEIIDSEEDLRRLQSEGLIPQDLRYEWGWIDPEISIDFSSQFLIAYYDAQRPLPGHLIMMGNAGKFIWNSGTLQGQLKTYALPTEPTDPSNLVSSVSIYVFGRRHTPDGLPDTLAFQGERSFEFQRDGVSMRKIKKLQPVISANQP